MRPKPTIEASTARFWRKVNKTETCWLWMKMTNSKGYGHFRFMGEVVRVHRLAWELCRGPIPEGMQVAHRCDIRRCVNPDHLFLATDEENKADMFAKERNPPINEKGQFVRTANLR